MEELSVLIEKSQAGDKETRSILIENNLGLVHHIVKRFAGRGYETEDLFQIGVIGLMKAIDKFDLSYDVKFSTYAVPMILGEIKRFLRDDGMIKVSRTIKENGLKVRVVSENLIKKLGREPRISEIAEESGLSEEEITVALEAGADVIMLDNMDTDALKEAIAYIDGRAEIEVSGNVTKENIARLTGLGVDYVSSGALTHSAPILDISLKNLHPVEN